MLLQYAWKSFWRRRTRSTMVVAGVALSVALLVAVVTVTQSVENAISSALAAAGADMVVQKWVKACPFRLVKLPPDLDAIDAEMVERLREHEGVEEASGVLELWAFSVTESQADALQLPFTGDKRADDAPAGAAAASAAGDAGAGRIASGGQGLPMVMGEDGQMKTLQPTVVAGIDPSKRTIGPVRLGKVEDRDEEDQTCCAVTDGRYLHVSDDYHAMVTEQYAEAKGLEVGDMLPLGPHHKFEVVGLVDISGTARIAGAEAFIPLATAQEMFGKGEVVDTIFVSLKSTRDSRAVAEYAEELIGEHARITTESNVEAGTAALASVTRNSLLAVSAFVLLFAMLALVRNAMDNVAQRVHEVGVMKAIGWRNSDVGRLFVAEAAYAALSGGLLGSILGSVIGWAYGQVADLSLPPSLNYFPPCSTTEAPLALPLTTNPSSTIFILGIAAALIIGTVAGLAASRRAAQLDPTEALRRI
ncbi:MAG: FtsX-like permease family protein [Armatimonadota bacterium]|nr:FtsX-like permease family protein [Armatimonadota bacterium]